MSMPRKLFVIVLAVLTAVAFAISSSAGVIRVSTSGSDSATGASWLQAKRTISAALSAASSGDDMWVAAGTYVECVSIQPGVALYGGFAGNETSRDQRDWNANATIIDGASVDAVVSIEPGADPSTRVDGFILQNGCGSAIGGLSTTAEAYTARRGRRLSATIPFATTRPIEERGYTSATRRRWYLTTASSETQAASWVAASTAKAGVPL